MRESEKLLSFPRGRKKEEAVPMYFIFVLCRLCSSSRMPRVKTRGADELAITARLKFYGCDYHIYVM